MAQLTREGIGTLEATRTLRRQVGYVSSPCVLVHSLLHDNIETRKIKYTKTIQN